MAAGRSARIAGYEPMSDDPSSNAFTDRSGPFAVTAVTVAASLLLLTLWYLPASVTGATKFVFIAACGLEAALLVLLVRSAADRRAWVIGLLGLPVLVALAAYTADSGYVSEDMVLQDQLVRHLAVMVVALFVAMPYLQLRRNREALDYARLYALAWDNALTLAMALALAGATALILVLWAALFHLIGIDFFRRLFSEPAFVHPVAGLMLGVGVALARTHGGVMRGLLRVCLALGQLLLPLLALVAVIFLPTLAFTGLEPLWKTGAATALLLVLVLGLVTLVNSVFQDGARTAPYRKPLSLLVDAALLTLPVYGVIAAISLGLRIQQYGWSVDRLWAAVLVGFALLYALGYAVAVVRRTPVWLSRVAPVNTAIALAVVAVLLLSQSPLFDLRRISAHSQFARIANGAVSDQALDLDYFRWELGRPGREALVRLRDTGHASAAAVDALLARTQRWGSSVDGGIAPAELAVIPAGTPMPAALAERLNARTAEHWFIGCAETGIRCRLLVVDLGGDATPEWIVVSPSMHIWTVLGLRDGTWKDIGRLQVMGDGERILQSLEAGRYGTADAPWKDLAVGDRQYRLDLDPVWPSSRN
jgi:hypothetical protein